jgi:5-oxoprolinase (ATP-hydrolysing)
LFGVESTTVAAPEEEEAGRPRRSFELCCPRTKENAVKLSEAGRWRVWIDTGGTFTDAVALDPEGATHKLKILSSSVLRARITCCVDPHNFDIDPTPPDGIFDGARLLAADGTGARIREQRGARVSLETPLDLGIGVGEAVALSSPLDAQLLAAHWLTATPTGHSLPPLDLRVATTRGTNALLERRGARCAMLLTRGLEDLLRIKTQQRPDLFARVVRKEPPFADLCLGIDARIDARGELLQALDLEEARRVLKELRHEEYESLGIALVHSHLDPALENTLAELAKDAGFEHVSVSSALAPVEGYLNRAMSCEINAYLQPILEAYLENVRASLGEGSRLAVMCSSGTLLPAALFQPIHGLLSGPAGGAIGAAAVAEQLGIDRALCFDMGGTSTDVARVDGGIQVAYAHRVGDATLPTEAVELETVAAGGGSICHVEHGLPKVGPQSAGADPGPACYGAGGPLALTDVNLLLGRIRPERFPFGLDLDAARERLRECLGELGESGIEAEERLLAGYLQLANERMAAAIRRVSVKRGHDPKEHALIAFGGAGGQHACAIAELLEIERVVFPPDASLLSAVGVGNARSSRAAQVQLLRSWESCSGELDVLLARLEAEAMAKLVGDGVSGVRIQRRVAELRLEGQESCLAIAFEHPDEVVQSFRRAYEAIYEHYPEERTIEVVSLHVHATGSDRWRLRPEALPQEEAAAVATALLHDGTGWVEAAVHERSLLGRGQVLQGPLLVEEAHSVHYLPRDWSLRVHEDGALLAERQPSAPGSMDRAAVQSRALSLELFQHRFEAIARSMGERLRRTAVSTNVKEREDFSCAILDPEASLVVNAPHIPVHLGALGSCLRAVLEHRALEAGDVIVTNHPAFGGSHLPDVTLLAAAHDANGDLLGYVASRAHHAEIGGIAPGSMPAGATRLVEEAVVIPPIYLARHGRTDLRELERLLRRSVHPSRTPEDNLADTQAMLAACRAGIEELRTLSLRSGRGNVVEHMRELRFQAARQMRATLASIPAGVHRAEEKLDDGSALAVAITIDHDADKIACFDFVGSADEHPGNLNATEAVVRSCVLYVLRLLVEEDLPFSEGLLDPVDLRIPRGILSPDFARPASECPAVVGGNVETSQRLVDCMLRALDLSAASQGTMNNLSFGNERFGYYETLGGGCGAQREFDGESGVHSHMTNTRITDVEVLEHRFPVRVLEFSLRRDSGGRGVWAGGEGLRRELLFLEKVQLSLLTQRRVAGAPGMHGGGSGMPGRQFIERADGRREELAPQDETTIEPGDRLIVETPGGGGWGQE